MLLAGTLGAQTTIVEYTAGTATSGAGFFFGQPFTVPAGGIRLMTAFHYFTNFPATTPAAVGKLYIFTAPYAGTPNGLNSALPNLIGVSSSVSGGQFLFSPAVPLNPSTTYHVYGDTSYIITGSNFGGVAFYSATSATSAFFPFPGGATNFRVIGSNAAATATVPIGMPALMSLSLLLAASASLLMRRQHRASI